MYCAGCGAETDDRPCKDCGAEPLVDGRYRLEAILGQGAFGTTWRAVDTSSDAVVAVKELPLRVGAPAKLVTLFEREASVLQQLAHPRIPAYLEHFVRGEGRQRAMYLVMQFVDGVSLEVSLASHRYDEREVLTLLASLLEVLVYLHTRSPPVVHRDIKPANVLLSEAGPVLIDFGSVRDALRDGSAGGSTVAGTFGYMAPEQFVGAASPASDLYALGALAVALLTRKEPHTLQDEQQRSRWHGHATLGAGTATLLDRLLATDDADRPASDQALMEVRRLLEEGTGGRSTALERRRAPELPAVRSASRLSLAATAPGAVTEARLGRMITTIEQISGLHGTVERLGETVRWRSQESQRQVTVTLDADEGSTRLLVAESLGALNGGVFAALISAGVMSAVGVVVAASFGWMPFLASVWGIALLAVFAILVVGSGVAIRRRIVQRREGELQEVIGALTEQLAAPRSREP